MQFEFELVSVCLKSELDNLAVESNDIYNSRTVDRGKALEVLGVPEKAFDPSCGTVQALRGASGELLGFFALAFPVDGEAELLSFFVRAGLQRRGLGRAMWQRVVSVLQQRSIASLHWISDPDAKDFYLAQGARIYAHDDNLLNPAVPVPLFRFDVPRSHDQP